MPKKSIDLLCSISELITLFRFDSNIPGFLQRAVKLIALHTRADVCSIYLASGDELVLRATEGLPAEFIGVLRLNKGEGITGRSLKELRPLRIPKASDDGSYKYIPGTYEEKFEAFIAVPIIHGMNGVGVLVLQHREPDYFSEMDEKTLTVLTSQLAATLENAQLLLDLRAVPTSAGTNRGKPPDTLHCNALCEGVAIGVPVFIGDPEDTSELLRAVDMSMGQFTKGDFLYALEKTERQLEELQRTMEVQLSEIGALIFGSHLMMLQDEAFSGSMREMIDAGTPVVNAVTSVVNTYIRLFLKSRNDLVQEKVHDVKDLGRRILSNLNRTSSSISDYAGKIILAKELFPSDLIKLAAQHAEGFVLYGISATAHLSILARSLNLPVVLTDSPDFNAVSEARLLIIDGKQHTVLVNPEDSVVKHYREVREHLEAALEEEEPLPMESYTRDGHRIHVLSNINLLTDMKIAWKYNAEGIGLYRTEFPFLIRNSFPGEEEQVRVYRRIFEDAGKREVILRTLDIGGDKYLSYVPNMNEKNPFLGLRAVRFSLKNHEVFSKQLRAMFRAAEGRELKLMFPLVASVDEYRQAREFTLRCLEELDAEDIPRCKEVEIGIMVELPSAVEMIGELIEESDFLSVGTNDLIQYLVGIDRTNEHVADLYTPYHPSVLRALYRVVTAAVEAGKEISVCGDAGSNPDILEFLIGCGLTRVSVDPRRLQLVKRSIALVSFAEARGRIPDLLACRTVEEVRSRFER